MIIPVRCVTCGKVLANKYQEYQKQVLAMEGKEINDNSNTGETEFATNFDKKMKGKILDKLYIDRICCRRHMLAHVDLIDII